ncbi:VOC family protein [uncultured Gelidibacter sp.]|uniref:VOC family protein n=1 Tax=uncultured Gelidibacter sp. TaxID=259318 RepID=UPI0026344CAA|nr:VOC family protein [uncultured Gelidibacter sp.]
MEAKNPIVWFEIYVDDLNRAQKFYETVLDIKLTTLQSPEMSEDDSGFKMIAFPMDMNGAGASGALVKMEGVKAGGNSTLVYFASEDCSIEEARVENARGTVFKPKMSIGEYGFITLFYDTEGNMVGLHSMA